MTEFLMPTSYSGKGFGISVMFAGLGGPYSKLELSIDGVQFFEVSQDAADPFYSAPHLFGGLTENVSHEVRGRVVTANNSSEVICIMVAAKAVSKARRASTSVYTGGGKPNPAQHPKASDY